MEYRIGRAGRGPHDRRHAGAGSATRSSTRSSRTGSPRASRVAKPGPLEPWDAPPTNHGFKGGDLLGIVEQLAVPRGPRRHRALPDADLPSASNHRYHTYDYFAVDPLLGGNEALRELLDAAHARGMRVVLDGVFNHTGRGFWPFHHVLETGAGVAVSATGSTSTTRRLAAGRPLLGRVPAARDAAATRSATPRWWGTCRRCPS